MEFLKPYYYNKNNKDIAKNFLNSLSQAGNNLILNRNAIALLGPDAALILAELISQWALWKEINKLDSEGYFFCTEEKIADLTGWKYLKQRNALDILKENNLIEIKNKGMPIKRHIRLNFRNILKIYNIKQ